jgi:Xaa-Pro dipeptidase
MRRAGEIMDRAVRTAFESLRPGVREYEIHAEVSRVLVGMTGGSPAVPPPISSGPNLMSQTSSDATDREIQPGDPFMIELGAQCRRYHAVCIRMASLGPPADRLKAMHDAILEGTGSALEMIKPGVPTADVARAVHRGFERHGFSRRGRQVGYGIGIGYAPTWAEAMMLRETDRHVLEPGMTFLLQGVLVDPAAEVAAAFGDPVLVTPHGCERLTTLPREMTLK